MLNKMTMNMFLDENGKYAQALGAYSESENPLSMIANDKVMRTDSAVEGKQRIRKAG